MEAHEHFISTVKFHKKYGVIATGGNDTVIKIWSLKWINKSENGINSYIIILLSILFIVLCNITNFIENVSKKQKSNLYNINLRDCNGSIILVLKLKSFTHLIIVNINKIIQT